MPIIKAQTPLNQSTQPAHSPQPPPPPPIKSPDLAGFTMNKVVAKRTCTRTDILNLYANAIELD